MAASSVSREQQIVSRPLFYWTEDGGLSVGDDVAEEMGHLLGWSAEQQSEQLSAYRAWVEANRFVAVAA